MTWKFSRSHQHLFVLATIAALACASVAQLFAQDPALVESNLKHSTAVADANHLIANVTVETKPGEFLRFRLDRYPEVVRITNDDGITYAKPKGKTWLKSNDWGKTGKRVNADLSGELDRMAQIVGLPFALPEHLDPTQGATVWKLLDKTAKDDLEYVKFERTRETPRPGGMYPIYTFIKYKSDKDGQLLLDHFAANMRMGDASLPLEIKFGYLILLPADSIKVIPAKPKSGSSN